MSSIGVGASGGTSCGLATSSGVYTCGGFIVGLMKQPYTSSPRSIPSNMTDLWRRRHVASGVQLSEDR